MNDLLPIARVVATEGSVYYFYVKRDMKTPYRSRGLSVPMLAEIYNLDLIEKKGVTLMIDERFLTNATEQLRAFDLEGNSLNIDIYIHHMTSVYVGCNNFIIQMFIKHDEEHSDVKQYTPYFFSEDLLNSDFNMKLIEQTNEMNRLFQNEDVMLSKCGTDFNNSKKMELMEIITKLIDELEITIKYVYTMEHFPICQGQTDNRIYITNPFDFEMKITVNIRTLNIYHRGILHGLFESKTIDYPTLPLGDIVLMPGSDPVDITKNVIQYAVDTRKLGMIPVVLYILYDRLHVL
jgi:hypothetical protein